MCEARAVLGCVRFLEGFYLLLATKRRCAGEVAGHKVYGIDATGLVPLLSAAAQRALPGRGGGGAAAEARYRRVLGALPLTTEFYFSYSYPLERTAQHNFGGGGGTAPGGGWGPEGRFGAFGPRSDRVWNANLTAPLRAAVGHASWVVPLVHGFFEQRLLSLLGKPLTLTLIARRSRQVRSAVGAVVGVAAGAEERASLHTIRDNQSHGLPPPPPACLPPCSLRGRGTGSAA